MVEVFCERSIAVSTVSRLNFLAYPFKTFKNAIGILAANYSIFIQFPLILFCIFQQH